MIRFKRHWAVRSLYPLAALILMVSIGVTVDQVIAQERDGPIDLYFLDLNTDQLFTAGSDQIPPIEAPSDREANKEVEDEDEKQYSGVRAHVFTCTTCEDEDDRWIGYLEKYSPEGKAAMEEATRGDGEIDVEVIYKLDEARLVKLPTDDDWIKANSEEGIDIYAAIRDRCEEDQRPRQCFPGRS